MSCMILYGTCLYQITLRGDIVDLIPYYGDIIGIIAAVLIYTFAAPQGFLNSEKKHTNVHIVPLSLQSHS